MDRILNTHVKVVSLLSYDFDHFNRQFSFLSEQNTLQNFADQYFEYVSCSCVQCTHEQGRHSGESIRFTPMRPGFNS